MTDAAAETQTAPEKSKLGIVTDETTPASNRGGNRRPPSAQQSAGGKQTAGEGTSGKKSAPKKPEQKAEGATDVPPASKSKKTDTPIEQPAEERGGTANVKITVVAVPARGGRPTGPEIYPFGKLGFSTVGEDGSITGPSFFLPRSAGHTGLIAAARKRYGKKALFLTRKAKEMNEETKQIEEGVRVWRGPDKQ